MISTHFLTHILEKRCKIYWFSFFFSLIFLKMNIAMKAVTPPPTTPYKMSLLPVNPDGSMK